MDLQWKEAYTCYMRQKQKAQRATLSSRRRLLELQVPKNDGWHPIDIHEPATFYKIAASVRGEMVSVYDGTTRYTIGRWTLGKYGAHGWPPLSSCFYAYQTVEKAISSQFPKDSKYRSAPRVLIQVTATGKAYFNPKTDMWALSSVRPVRILPNSVPAYSDAGVADIATIVRGPGRVDSVTHQHSKSHPWVP
ncbi:hypothetical protein Vretimale_465 [Volvox reticuliferus]|uniref:Uncharacterized protein n=1 Tax=Volvox reticuliferus TaxID=1737510 RepID=A0A8J4BZ79_9CHLO|nr:hypothetical protein Vretifemale_2547 [Volvox reticuliferus]GIL94192.1 hypothetical protein Vretimale_465 [Volvox reticuliferus]